jgi:GNAT superfamily N-acetyltransferase
MACVFSSADQNLAVRLEAAEAGNLLKMAQTATASLPDIAFEPYAGGFAVFAGVGSPMTHAMGIGLRGSVAQDEMERMETFFRDRGSACFIDLCPMADISVISFLRSRPYRAIEFNNVLARRIQPDEIFEPSPGVQLMKQGEMTRWARVVGGGFSDPMPVSDEIVQMMVAACKATQCWFAGDGDPVGGAAMGIHEDVAVFCGDATLAAARGKGWQSLLIRERLAAAQRQGCSLAMVSVLPGSTSHRNYERAGFQLIYMRVNLMREFS